ncbi:MAG TPA: YdeI/OmpD-associated family protein [Thermoanaerobaculia bacterium]|jgi:uncharacterized protein YdeI (YjbR/CyaY-like superfamily)|nr:YdeI/OmpD-associated family protein [Thermoanaerobaculia bacterium]
MASRKQTPADLPVLRFPDTKALSAWLEEHHAAASGIWLRIAKKGSGVASVTYAEALEVALLYGWIDGQKKSFDETSWIQKFTPRGARSIWSKINREKAEALIASGRMKPAGLAAVEQARQNGRWDAAYDRQGAAAVPDDLQAALDASPRAKAFFATLNSVNRYAILFRVQTVKKAETRAKKIQQFVKMLEEEKKIHP